MTEIKIEFGEKLLGTDHVEISDPAPAPVESAAPIEVLPVTVERQKLILDGLWHSRNHGYNVDNHFTAIYKPNSARFDKN